MEISKSQKSKKGYCDWMRAIHKDRIAKFRAEKKEAERRSDWKIYAANTDKCRTKE